MAIGVGMFLALLALPVQAVEVRYEGRPVVAVLEELRADGLQLVYNTSQVPLTLHVLHEPQAHDPRQIAVEILEPHGMTLAPVSGQLFAVVALPPSGRPGAARALPEEVVVASSRYALATIPQGSHAYFTPAQVDNMPRLLDEPLRAVQRLPGAAGNGLSGLARIRGGEEGESQIMLNGLGLFEPFHLKNFFGPVSLLDARLLGGMDVFTGGYTVEYGDRMSAVVDAHTLQLPRDRRYELGLNVFHTHGLASGTLAGGRGTWLAAMRRSNLHEIADLSSADLGELDYQDGFARATIEVSPNLHLAFNALGSQDRVTLKNTGDRELSAVEYRNQYLWVEADHVAGALHSRLVASLTAVDNDRRGTVDDPVGVTGEVADEREFTVFGLRYEGRLLGEDSGRLRHRWGVELRALRAQYRYDSFVRFADEFLLPVLSLPPPARAAGREFAVDPKGNQYAAWWSTRLRVLPQLTAELGVRWDAQSYTGPGLDEQFSPRLNLLYEINEHTRLRASWGRFFQSQGIHELQVEDGIDAFLPAQRADHLIFSLERELSPQTQLRVELYRKDYERLRPRYENLFDPLVLLPELQFDRVRIAPDSARMQAVETLFSWQPVGSWNAWMSYTFAYAEDRFGDAYVPRSWDQRHAVQAGIDRSGVRWDFSMAAVWHSGWPDTNASVSDGVTPAIVADIRNAGRLQDFSSIDLRLSRRFELRRGELQVIAELTNAANRQNACCHRYEARRLADGAIELDSRARYWLPLAPSLGVVWEF